jgi:hypothetical protein
MKPFLMICLKTALALVLFWSVLAQIGIPMLGHEFYVDNYPNVRTVQLLWLPYSIAAILAILCGQIAILFIYRLLRLVATGTIFSAPVSARYTKGIVICFGIATAISALVTLTQFIVPDGGHFSTAFLTISTTSIGLVLTLLMIVMRSLLDSAVAYRGELDTVI